MNKRIIVGVLILFLILKFVTAVPPPPPAPEFEEEPGDCTESWVCTGWDDCVEGEQTRTCTDENECGTTVDKPAETQICCADNDGDGYGQNCDNGPDCDDSDADINPGAAEVCDDKDNNCDGTTDEGCACTSGTTQQCGTTDVGFCEYGIQTCSDGAWGTCEGNIEPVTEVCNDNIDNDCDGEVDENCEVEEETDGTFIEAIKGVIKEESKKEEIVETEEEVCDGCIIDDNCVKEGVQKGEYFCGPSYKAELVKNIGEPCTVDYECESYFCNNGYCDARLGGKWASSIWIGAAAGITAVLLIIAFFLYKAGILFKKVSEEEKKMEKKQKKPLQKKVEQRKPLQKSTPVYTQKSKT